MWLLQIRKLLSNGSREGAKAREQNCQSLGQNPCGKIEKKPRLFHVKDSKVRNKNNTGFQKVFVT